MIMIMTLIQMQPVPQARATRCARARADCFDVWV
jgi:hypothetical protein